MSVRRKKVIVWIVKTGRKIMHSTRGTLVLKRGQREQIEEQIHTQINI